MGGEEAGDYRNKRHRHRAGADHYGKRDEFGNHKPDSGKTKLLAFADDTAGWEAGYSPAHDTITIPAPQ